jgi:hypothetical protein
MITGRAEQGDRTAAEAIETWADGLQKVSAAVELNKAAPTQVADTR